MAQIDNVIAKQQAVQQAVASLATDISTAKTALEAEIARVEALISAGAGATPAQLQSLSDGLDATLASVTAADTSAGNITTEANAERP